MISSRELLQQSVETVDLIQYALERQREFEVILWALGKFDCLLIMIFLQNGALGISASNESFADQMRI